MTPKVSGRSVIGTGGSKTVVDPHNVVLGKREWLDIATSGTDGARSPSVRNKLLREGTSRRLLSGLSLPHPPVRDRSDLNDLDALGAAEGDAVRLGPRRADIGGNALPC